MTYLAGEILAHLVGAFLAGLALGWLIWGFGRRRPEAGDKPRDRGTAGREQP